MPDLLTARESSAREQEFEEAFAKVSSDPEAAAMPTEDSDVRSAALAAGLTVSKTRWFPKRQRDHSDSRNLETKDESAKENELEVESKETSSGVHLTLLDEPCDEPCVPQEKAVATDSHRHMVSGSKSNDSSPMLGEAMPPAIGQPTLHANSHHERSSVPSCASPSTSGSGSPPLTGLQPAPGGKDWRRSFVQKAVKANRKVEYLHGSQCRETHEVNEPLEEAVRALENGIKPDLVEDGLGGTYFIKDRGRRNIGVFKPRDEEPLAPNNPKVHAGDGQGSGLKDGVLVGDAALNEYACFLIDKAASATLRAGVSPTVMVRMAASIFHEAEENRRSAFLKVKDKVGSFQLFAAHDCISEDMSPHLFPTDLVHKLAALDMRICNSDRHSGNILVRKDNQQVTALVPIDHGYALPAAVGGSQFEWLSWPASKRPFSEEIRNEILDIDIDAVEALLKKRVPCLRPSCLVTLRTCTLFLQRGVAAGLTAFDIGSMMCREEVATAETPSPCTLELLVAKASCLPLEGMCDNENSGILAESDIEGAFPMFAESDMESYFPRLSVRQSSPGLAMRTWHTPPRSPACPIVVPPCPEEHFVLPPTATGGGEEPACASSLDATNRLEHLFDETFVQVMQSLKPGENLENQ